MKLYREVHADLNLVSAYDLEGVTVRGVRYTENLVLTPDSFLAPWAAGRSLEQLQQEDLAQIRNLNPALVLLGTGPKQRFPHPSLFRPLIEAGIGFEVMDTGSACRTYNILASEGRRVAAGLLFI